MPYRPNAPIRARKKPPIRCAFCDEIVPKPRIQRNLFSVDDCKGGRCTGCDAVFVLDEAGKHGGSALLDGLVMVCDGDMDRAMKLQAKVDYRVAAIHEPGVRHSRHNVEAKIWFIQLRRRKTDDDSTVDAPTDS